MAEQPIAGALGVAPARDQRCGGLWQPSCQGRDTDAWRPCWCSFGDGVCVLKRASLMGETMMALTCSTCAAALESGWASVMPYRLTVSS